MNNAKWKFKSTSRKKERSDIERKQLVTENDDEISPHFIKLIFINYKKIFKIIINYIFYQYSSSCKENAIILIN